MGKKIIQTETRNPAHKFIDAVEEKPARSPGAPGEMQEKNFEKLLHELRVHQIELEMQNEELKKAQLALEGSRQRYADLYDFAPVGYFSFTREALIKEANITGATLLGVARQKLINRRFRLFIGPSDFDLWDRHFLSVLQQEKKQTCDLTLKRQDGSTFQAGLESIRIEVSRGAYEVHTVVTDITEHMQAEKQERLAREVLDLLNRKEGEEDSIRNILGLVKKNTGLEAVGIRLREGDDFPYYQTNGFSEDFVHAERFLCVYDAEGNIVRDGVGTPVLEGMCGNILCGRTNSDKPFFTEAGSFWANSTTKLLASTTEEERQSHTRNRCNGEGYESVALIPLRSGDEIIGLLQLNDRRPNRFNPEMIRFFEGLGASIGIALSRKRADRENTQLYYEREEMAEMLRLILNTTDQGIFGYDLDSICIFVNRASTEMLGYALGELMGKNLHTLIHHSYPDGSPYPLENCPNQITMETGQNCHRDNEVFWRSNGQAFPVEYSSYPIRQKGKILGAVVTFMDITGRKLAEESLRRSDEKISKAFRASPDWMTISTLEDGRYVDVNDAFVELSGFSREGALGKSLIELDLWVDPHDRDRAVAIIRKEGGLNNFECKIRLKSGEVRIMLWSAEVFDLEGQKYVTSTKRDITELRKAQENLEQALEHLRRSLGGTIEVVAMTSEARDPYTAGHQKRVADLARAIAQEMGLPEGQVKGLHMAGAIHDLGKISVPAEILSKPTKLSDIEFGLIKAHPQIGYDILKNVDFLWPICRMILEHHERLNGSGYPNGLTGDQLLQETKILMVADVVEAMASYRPYRPALGIDKALEEISQNKGILYDPEVSDVCLRLFREKGYKFE